MRDTRPSEKFLERGRDLLIGHRIRMCEKHRAIRLSDVARGRPVEIPFTIRSKAKAFSPTLCLQIDDIFLALQIKRQKSLYPFRGVLRFRQIVRIRVWPANFKSLRKNGLVIVVKREKPLRKTCANSLLDFVRMRMYQSVSEGIARCFVFLGS